VIRQLLHIKGKRVVGVFGTNGIRTKVAGTIDANQDVVCGRTCHEKRVTAQEHGMKDKDVGQTMLLEWRPIDKVRQLTTIFEDQRFTFQLCVPDAPNPLVAPGNPTFTPLGNANVEVYKAHFAAVSQTLWESINSKWTFLSFVYFWHLDSQFSHNNKIVWCALFFVFEYEYQIGAFPEAE
jgi:hypothetical protein